MLNEYPEISEIPIGLGFALMQNKAAMDYFAALPDEGKRRIIEHTHAIRSKEEMRAYVETLGQNILM